MMITGNGLPSHRQQIHRQQVHRIHQENPHKHSQTQRGDCFARLLVVHDAFAHIIYEFKQQLHRSLKATGHTRRGFAGGTPQQEAAQRTQQHREENGIQIDIREIGDVFQALALGDIRQTGQAL